MGKKSKKDGKKKKVLTTVGKGIAKRKTIEKYMIKPDIINITTRTLDRYFPIFCNLFQHQSTAPGHLPLYTAPAIHSVIMVHDPKTGNLTFDEIETVLSCYNRPDLPDGDFLCYIINVINYIPSGNHFIAAVKYNRKLYFFNSWGNSRSAKYKTLDRKVINHLRRYIDVIYPTFPIQSSVQYNGPALQAACGRTGVNVPVRLNVNGRTVIAAGGFCGLISLDFIVLMRLLQSRGMILTNTNSFNRYISQLGNIGLVAGGRMRSLPTSIPNGSVLPIARLNHASRANRGLSYVLGRLGNVTLAEQNYTFSANGIPSPNVRKYILFYEPINGNGYNRVTGNFSTKVSLVNYLRNYKNRGINLTNFSISKSNSIGNRKRITNAGGTSTGPRMYTIPFQSLYINVNNSRV